MSKRTWESSLTRAALVFPVLLAVSTAVATWLVLAHRFARPLPGTLVWSVIVLWSFVGWGAVVERALFRDRRADWGLRASWGMCALVAIGGMMTLARVSSRPTLVGLVLAGVLALAIDMVKQREGIGRDLRALPSAIGKNLPFCAGLGLVAVLTLMHFVGSPLEPGYASDSDDLPIYFALPKEILDAGTSIQPFSLRRISSYQGLSFLQALTIVASPTEHVYVLDRGISLVIALGLVLGPLRTSSPMQRVLLLLPLGVLITAPNMRANAAATMSGVVVFLALYRTLEWEPVRSTTTTRNAALLGLIVAAACTLRQNYILPVVLLVTVSDAFQFFRGGLRAPWSARWPHARELLLTGAFTVLFLVPWMIVSYQSCATFLFPLVAGNLRRDGAFEPIIDVLTYFRMFIQNMTFGWPVAPIGFFVFAWLLYNDDSPRKSVHASFIAAAVGFVAVVHFFARALPEDNARYYFAFELAAVAALAMATTAALPADGCRATGTQPLLAVGLVVVAALLQMHDAREYVSKQYVSLATSLQTAIKAPPPVRGSPTPAEAAYAELQNAVPPKEQILAMVDDGYLFDFRRNRVYLIDLPGVVNPQPGFPWREGADAVRRYLEGLGIRYVIMVKNGSSKHLYNKALWVGRMDFHGHAASDREVYPQGVWAAMFVDLLTEFESLAATHKRLAETSGMVVVDLATPNVAR